MIRLQRVETRRGRDIEPGYLSGSLLENVGVSNRIHGDSLFLLGIHTGRSANDWDPAWTKLNLDVELFALS